MSVNKTRVFGTVHTLNSGAYPDTQENMRQAVEELKVEGTLPRDVELRSNAYLNNIIEQDHRRVKQWVGPMLGFKRFDHAAIILAGIELTHKLRKGQFNFSKLIKRSARLQIPGGLPWLRKPPVNRPFARLNKVNAPEPFRSY
jgi:hypothetical protein